VGYSAQSQLWAMDPSECFSLSKLTLGKRHADKVLPSLPISLHSSAMDCTTIRVVPFLRRTHLAILSHGRHQLFSCHPPPSYIDKIRTYPCFTGNSNLPLHHVQRPIGVLGGSSKEALRDQSAYPSTWTSTSSVNAVSECPRLPPRVPQAV
jgi:hypothetical protein